MTLIALSSLRSRPITRNGVSTTRVWTKSHGLQTRHWLQVDRWTRQSLFGPLPVQPSTQSLKVRITVISSRSVSETFFFVRRCTSAIANHWSHVVGPRDCHLDWPGLQHKSLGSWKLLRWSSDSNGFPLRFYLFIQRISLTHRLRFLFALNVIHLSLASKVYASNPSPWSIEIQAKVEY